MNEKNIWIPKESATYKNRRFTFQMKISLPEQNVLKVDYRRRMHSLFSASKLRTHMIKVSKNSGIKLYISYSVSGKHNNTDSNHVIWLPFLAALHLHTVDNLLYEHTIHTQNESSKCSPNKMCSCLCCDQFPPNSLVVKKRNLDLWLRLEV